MSLSVQGNRILTRYAVQPPSFPRKRESRGFRADTISFGQRGLDSRFRGNDDLLGSIKLECVCPVNPTLLSTQERFG